MEKIILGGEELVNCNLIFIIFDLLLVMVVSSMVCSSVIYKRLDIRNFEDLVVGREVEIENINKKYLEMEPQTSQVRQRTLNYQKRLYQTQCQYIKFDGITGHNVREQRVAVHFDPVFPQTP